MSGPDVMGREEVADVLGVSVRRVGQLLDTDPMFPRAERDRRGANVGATKLARGLVWDGPAIRAYKKDRGRPDPKHTKVLQSFRKTHNVAQAARTAGCAVTTARRVLVDVGLIPAPTRGQDNPCPTCGDREVIDTDRPGATSPRPCPACQKKEL